jgi:hypothetical protein
MNSCWGADFTAPVGIRHKYLTPSYYLQVTGGRNFNKAYGLLEEKIRNGI